MPKADFSLVDLATWRTPQGKPIVLSPAEKERILCEGCSLISNVFPIKPSQIRRPWKGLQRHLLAVLSQGKPISAFYYHLERSTATGKRFVRFHFAGRESGALPFARARGETPALSLFRWMKRAVGKDAVLVVSAVTPQGARFIRRLEGQGILEQMSSGYRDEFSFTGKPVKRPKARKNRPR
ncbi:MAG: hypothetical protein NTW59_00765 [Candidatus Diapherotrites archaeon]|nr:hypothetical protein [Candidatus Diapherotrites archaeon]